MLEKLKSVVCLSLATCAFLVFPAGENTSITDNNDDAGAVEMTFAAFDDVNDGASEVIADSSVVYYDERITHALDYAEEKTIEKDEEAYIYSDDEKELIARVVYAEARGEKRDGKVAVAQVVLNRFESGRFGKTVKRVVFAKHQFAVSKKYNDECMHAVEEAIEQRPYPENMFYFQVSKKKKWRNFVFYERIGNHNFFCSKN